MEIRQYLLLFWKWLWLLILGVALGGGGAYLYSSYQPVVYQTRTKIMVSQPQNNDNQMYTSYFDVQLAQTYAQIINTGPVLELLGQKLEYPVSKGQVSVAQVTGSQLIEITVTDNQAAKTAEIANGLVDVFIEYNKNLQNDRFQSVEDSLQLQIKQIEGQMTTLQGELEKASANDFASEQQQLADQQKQIEKLMAAADQEVIGIETQLEVYYPTPAVTNTPAPSWIIPTATPVPVATPTLSAAAAQQYKELQIRRDQLNGMREMYQKAYSDLLSLGKASTTDPALRQSQIQATLALYQQIYSGLLSNYENVRLARLRSMPSVVQVEQAVVPKTPIQPLPERNGMLGGVAGLMVMGAIAFLIEYMDDTLKTPEDVHQQLGLPVIGMIGEMERKKAKDGAGRIGVYVMDNPLSPISESFRSLRANLEFAGVDKPLRSLLVTSAAPGEGKTTTAVNLAAIMGQSEREVILIDADLRKPMVHRYVGIPNRKGLADLFRDGTKVENVLTKWGETQIGVITSGSLPPNPSELLGSERMTALLRELKDESNIVIADSPPAIVADPIVLAAKMDGVLIVVEPGKTRIGAAQVLKEQLQRAGARVIGVVLNPISRRRSQYYTKYYHYSQYYKKKGYYRYGNDQEDNHNGHRRLLGGKNGRNGKVSQSEQATQQEGKEN